MSLSWLSQAFDFLSFTHAEARSVISDLKSSSLDDDSVTRYLDESVKILDLCNAVSSHVEKLRHGGLLVNFFLHLAKSSATPPPEKLRRARDSIAEWKISPSHTARHGFESSLADLVTDLAARLGGSQIRKISSIGRLIHRTIHAVELVTVFVATAAASAFTNSPDLKPVRAPAEFSWSDSFNDLDSTFSAELNRRGSFQELDDVDTESNRNRLNGAVKELEKAREKLTEGLDGLVNGVNGTFKTVLCTRNDLLANFRLGPNEKRPKRCV